MHSLNNSLILNPVLADISKKTHLFFSANSIPCSYDTFLSSPKSNLFPAKTIGTKSLS
jgi:hypothetical protein